MQVELSTCGSHSDVMSLGGTACAAVGRGMRLVVELVGLQQAVAEADDPLGVGGDVVFVRDHDDRLALVVQLLEQRQDLFAWSRESRLPVASSARMKYGSFTRLRAMATRCC